MGSMLTRVAKYNLFNELIKIDPDNMVVSDYKLLKLLANDSEIEKDVEGRFNPKEIEKVYKTGYQRSKKNGQ